MTGSRPSKRGTIIGVEIRGEAARCGARCGNATLLEVLLEAILTFATLLEVRQGTTAEGGGRRSRSRTMAGTGAGTATFTRRRRAEIQGGMKLTLT